MDRLIAPGTVDAAHADVAPATGTPGYATDGNPATNTPATQWPAYAFNAIQEELLAVILAAGLTPDRSNNAQLLEAIQGVAHLGITAISGLTNANVTLSDLQAAKPIITLAGTLTGNIQVIFPATQQQWLVVNATTGSFTVSCKTAAGTGVAVAQGGGARVYGDGTNIVLPAEQVGAATQAAQAVQLGQLQQNYAWNHRIDVMSSTGNYTVQANTYWLDVELWAGSGGGGGVSTIGNGGGGAGGGGYCRGVIAVTPGQVIPGTVGAGGAIDSGSGGGRGGTTSFGSLSATGGFGGATGNASTPGAGGAGGTASGGSINLSGQDGTGGGAGSTGSGGSGGAACFGGTGGIGGGPVSSGAAGAFPGGGSGGHGGGSTGSSLTGRPGYIIIHS